MTKSILGILTEIESTSSRKEKEAILFAQKDNQLLKAIVHLALSPKEIFYIKKIPMYATKQGDKIDLWEAMHRLELLSSRQLTGNSAIEMLENLLSYMEQDDAIVVERIIKKDLRCGIAESTVNKIWKNLIPEWPCMLCSAYDTKLVEKFKFPALAQLKLDGMRFNAIYKDGDVTYVSRNGKPILINSPELDKEFCELASAIGFDVVFDGELLVVDEKGNILDRKTGNGILNKAVKGTISDEECNRVRAKLWDVIPFGDFESGKYKNAYTKRLEFLDVLNKKMFFRIGRVESSIVNNLNEVQKLFKAYLALGQEGLILKDPNGIWENKRTKSQIKFKEILQCELVVVGTAPGTGKYEGMLGAIICESADGVIKVDVGSGFTDEMRVTGVPIGSIVTVEYNQRITNKKGEQSLFLPVFVEVRYDKDEADSSDKIE